MATRTGTDSMGPIDVDANRYRARRPSAAPPLQDQRREGRLELIGALATIRRQPALVSAELGLLPAGSRPDRRSGRR
jgi:fumarate hydratase class II